MPTQPCTRFDCDCPSFTTAGRAPDTSQEMHRDQEGRYHRLDGPALVLPDRALWYRHGKPHRTDGPSYCLGSSVSSPWWHLEGEGVDITTFINDWLTRHHPETDPTTRALLHDLANPWPDDCTLATLYTAAHAAARH